MVSMADMVGTDNLAERLQSLRVLANTIKPPKPPQCPICRDDKFLYEKLNGELVNVRRCPCQIEADNAQRIEKSGLSTLFRDCTFDTYITREEWQKIAKNKAQAFVSECGKWFCICGQTGSGKTHLCTAVCAEYIKNASVIFMPWREGIEEIKAVYFDDENATNRNALMSKYKCAPVLYVDDLFKGKITQTDINIAFEIFNHRYNNRLITVISSEKTIEELLEVDEAIGGRIFQMCGKEYVINLKGAEKNMRLRRGA